MIEGPGVWWRFHEDEVTRQQVRPGTARRVWQLYGPLHTMSSLPVEILTCTRHSSRRKQRYGDARSAGPQVVQVRLATW